MEQSPLQLEHYNLQRISILPAPEGEVLPLGMYANFGDAKFGSTVSTGVLNLENGDVRQTVCLELVGGPKADTSKFPYHFEIAIVGIFNGSQLPEERREELVLVNGASLLYGVARELLLGLSGRFQQGAIMLPSVQFWRLAEQRKEQAEARS